MEILSHASLLTFSFFFLPTKSYSLSLQTQCKRPGDSKGILNTLERGWPLHNPLTRENPSYPRRLHLCLIQGNFSPKPPLSCTQLPNTHFSDFRLHLKADSGKLQHEISLPVQFGTMQLPAFDFYLLTNKRVNIKNVFHCRGYSSAFEASSHPAALGGTLGHNVQTEQWLQPPLLKAPGSAPAAHAHCRTQLEQKQEHTWRGNTLPDVFLAQKTI